MNDLYNASLRGGWCRRQPAHLKEKDNNVLPKSINIKKNIIYSEQGHNYMGGGAGQVWLVNFRYCSNLTTERHFYITYLQNVHKSKVLKINL